MFFSLESLKVSDDITNLLQESYFYLLAMSKIEFRQEHLSLVNVLLLSKNISTNPGPTQNQMIWKANDIPSPFEKRGLHIIQLNIACFQN